MTKAVLVDLRKCIGCRGCQVACKRWNDREAEETTLNATPGSEWTNPSDLSPQTYTFIRFVGKGTGEEFQWHFAKVQCMHCHEPQCAAVCPTKALYKTTEGPVLWDPDLCIGCGYCLQGCPFNVPRFDHETKKIEKCTFCAERLLKNLEPACVQACPTDALFMGEHDEIHNMVNEAEAAGAYVYGKEEAGGTSWIYVSDIPLTDLDFPKVASKTPLANTVDFLGKFAVVGVVGGAAIFALQQYSERRKKIKETSKEEV